MTDRSTNTRKSTRKILAVVLFVIAGALLIAAAFGLIQQGTQQTLDNMLAMRDEAVVYASSKGLINSVAQTAKSMKMEELSPMQRNAKTRKPQSEIEVILAEAEETARKEAEKLFVVTGNSDAEGFRSAVDQMTAAVSESTGLKEKELANYDDLYVQLMESVASWREIAPKNAGKQEIADALIRAVPDLGKEENSHLLSVDGFVKMAKDMAEEEQGQEDKEQKEYILRIMAAGVNNWLDYADLDDGAVWEKLKTDIPELETYAEWEKDLVSGVKDCVTATTQGSKLPAWTAAADEEEAESAEIIPIHDYFVNSPELDREQAEQKKAYEVLEGYLKQIIPELDNLKENLALLIPSLEGNEKKIQKNVEIIRDDLNKDIEVILSQKNKGFDIEYQAYVDNGGEKAVAGGQWQMKVAALAKYLLLAGAAVLLLGLVLFFWKQLTTRFGVPRTIIIMFFIFLCLLAEGYRISVGMMLGNVLERMTMYGILVLAMMPGIQCGIGLNMGMTIGCISGLLGIVMALQYNMTGFGAMLFACAVGIVVALPLGWAYSKLLNRMKGNEMTISTYVGFSFVSLMCIGWMLLPFNNPKIVWLLSGKGLRVTHGLLGSFAHILDNLLSFKVLGIKIPTGGLLFLGVCCMLMWIFTRSKTGIAMKAVGSNPRFAEASGISVDRMRTVGTVLSTVIAAVGIVIYSQAFGYAQLYTAPRQLGFIASSAILIGGASVTKAKVSHVLLGVFLFEGVLVFGQQIANSAIAGGGLSEVMRILISNGIILYALTQSGGGKRE